MAGVEPTVCLGVTLHSQPFTFIHIHGSAGGSKHGWLPMYLGAGEGGADDYHFLLIMKVELNDITNHRYH